MGDPGAVAIPRARTFSLLRETCWTWPEAETQRRSKHSRCRTFESCTARLLGTTVASVNSALQRARARLAEARASSDLSARHLAGPEERHLLDRYIAALEQGDIASLVRLVSADVTMTMPPDPTWFRGRDDVAR